jgi:hypothetical protein
MEQRADAARVQELRESGYLPDGKTPLIEKLGDVTRLAREFKKDGIPSRIFKANGLGIEAAAAGLRARGYVVEVRGSINFEAVVNGTGFAERVETADTRTLHLTGNPGSQASKHKGRWERLFGAPDRPSMFDAD